MDERESFTDDKRISQIELQSRGKTEALLKYKKQINSVFKFKIFLMIQFFEHHPCLFTIFQLLLGLITIFIPSFLLYFFTNVVTPSGEYIMLPFFVTFSLMCGLIVLLFVFRLADDCHIYGILIASWERKNVCRLFNTAIIMFIVLWGFLSYEQFFIDLISIKEKVIRVPTRSQTVNSGSFLLRYLFIFIFWKKDPSNLNPNKGKLGYFVYENDFMHDFRDFMSKLVTPIIFLQFYYLFKIILIRSKNTLVYLALCIVGLFECFWFEFYPVTEIKGEEYFPTDFRKFFEVIPLIIILLLVSGISVKLYLLRLLRKKLYTYRSRRSNLLTVGVSLLSFLLTNGGIVIYLFMLICSLFIEINYNTPVEVLDKFWFLLILGFLMITGGLSYAYGVYIFALVFGPVAFELCPSVLKNSFYTRYSSINQRLRKIKKKKKKKSPGVATPVST